MSRQFKIAGYPVTLCCEGVVGRNFGYVLVILDKIPGVGDTISGDDLPKGVFAQSRTHTVTEVRAITGRTVVTLDPWA